MLDRQVTLSSVAEGAAEELFQHAFKQLVMNAMDPNTPAKATRRLTLTFSLVVDEKRQNTELKIACASKIAPIMPVSQPIRVGMHQGEYVAVEPFTQEEMFNTPHGRPAAVVEGGASAV